MKIAHLLEPNILKMAVLQYV